MQFKNILIGIGTLALAASLPSGKAAPAIPASASAIGKRNETKMVLQILPKVNEVLHFNPYDPFRVVGYDVKTKGRSP